MTLTICLAIAVCAWLAFSLEDNLDQERNTVAALKSDLRKTKTWNYSADLARSQSWPLVADAGAFPREDDVASEGKFKGSFLIVKNTIDISLVPTEENDKLFFKLLPSPIKTDDSFLLTAVVQKIEGPADASACVLVEGAEFFGLCVRRDTYRSVLGRSCGGEWSATTAIAATEPNHLSFLKKENRVRLFINERQVVDCDADLQSEKVGLAVHFVTKEEAVFRFQKLELRIKPRK